MHLRFPLILLLLSLNSITTAARAAITLDKTQLNLATGDFHKLTITPAPAGAGAGAGATFTSSNPKIALAYPNGYIIALAPGNATITVRAGAGAGSGAGAGAGGSATCTVHVTTDDEDLIDPSTLQQYPDNRVFTVGERKCVGTILNGHMVGNEQKPRIDRNRVLNPTPFDKDNPLQWELKPAAPVYDGAGTLMGTTAPTIKVGDKKFTCTKVNYGFSKVINGQFCVYGFTIDISPSAAVRPLLPPEEQKKSVLATSAWVPLDAFVDKLTLLDTVGLGKGKLPRLPLLATRYKITGGNPHFYDTPSGELAIVDKLDGPVPSDYLRRTTGTVNILYTVPGFYIGGHSLDSLLITSSATFRPARGVRQFPMPTYFPKGHPQQGKKSPKTMTFIYGAVEAKGTETIYGWIAKEALVPAPAR